MNKIEDETRLKECKQNISDSIMIEIERLLADDRLIQDLIQKLQSLKEYKEDEQVFYIKKGLLARFLLSCLIEADRLDTASFKIPHVGAWNS